MTGDANADPNANAGECSLVAVVEKPRAEDAIASLRAEGVYDDDRRVVEYGEEAIGLPITGMPVGTTVETVVSDDPEPRLRTLEDHLRERGWTAAEIDRAPGSWAVVGSVVLVEVGDVPRPAELGAALLDLHAEADTVLSQGGIGGPHREPDVTVIAGEGDTETVHTEHGTRYALDLATVMFSPGNKAERARIGDVVDPGERVFDMFAGIGYFTLPMARAGADVAAAERNPAAFRYLLENAALNGVTDRIDAYRADCRDVAVAGVDRVVMGYYEAHEYLDSALAALAPGGTLHMHEATPESLVPDRPVGRLESAADAAGRTVEILDCREVKTYSEGVAHVVVDARL